MEVKNPEDLVFSSTGTDTHFILTSSLKGYQVQSFWMRMKGVTTQIADSGAKADRIQVSVSVAVQAASGVKIFRKLFLIPDGVVLDQIKTEFNEEESVLRVLMPKSVRGVRGDRVEEIRRGHKTTWHVPDKVPETEKRRKNAQEMAQGNKDVPQHEPEEASGVTITHPEEEPIHQLNQRDLPSTQETPAKEDADLEAKSRAAGGCEQGPEAAESTKVEADQATQRAQVEECNAQAQLKPKQENDLTEPLKPDHPEEKVDNREGSLAPPKKCRPCSLCLFAGSAILVSIVALAIHFGRPKRR
ncbi:hypothetical protein PVL29_024477 [Vitis rotundifolia]|uniref:SHSP domain-containing protein n=1 Tax=Vitis rotundifolia TaxID=103349 RepID=A0AA38YSB5_VITRO|nr:hypothetical protein PVL29_024477 [Vitis rotundifolia]